MLLILMVNSLFIRFNMSTAEELQWDCKPKPSGINLCCLFSAFISCSTGIQLCLTISLASPKPSVSLHEEQYCFTFFTCRCIVQVSLNTYCRSHIPDMLWFREMAPPACGELVSIAAKILRPGGKM